MKKRKRKHAEIKTMGGFVAPKVFRFGKQRPAPTSCARCGCPPSFPHFIATDIGAGILKWRSDVMYCMAFCARASLRAGEVVVTPEGEQVWPPKEVA